MKRIIKKTGLPMILVIGVVGFSLQALAFSDTTVCLEGEMECERIIIGNHVYLHYGIKVIEQEN